MCRKISYNDDEQEPALRAAPLSQSITLTTDDLIIKNLLVSKLRGGIGSYGYWYTYRRCYRVQ